MKIKVSIEVNHRGISKGRYLSTAWKCYGFLWFNYTVAFGYGDTEKEAEENAIKRFVDNFHRENMKKIVKTKKVIVTI